MFSTLPPPISRWVCGTVRFEKERITVSNLSSPAVFPAGVQILSAMSNAPESKVARAKMHAEDKRRTTIVNSMSPASKNKYDDIKKYSDKAAFRNVYETDHPIKSIETEKKDEQVDMKENWKHATYEPLAIIIKKEGGNDDPEACNAGLNIAKKRLATGFPMCAYNEDSERTEYLYFKKRLHRKIHTA